jgi:hypothetical protein
VPARGVALVHARRFQEEVFRLYTLHRIRAVPLEEFLSKCKLIDYVDDNGARQQVGQCDEGRHSTPWFFLSLVYDPSGQLHCPDIAEQLRGGWRCRTSQIWGASRYGFGFRIRAWRERTWEAPRREFLLR